jgi:hypothetical protein
LTADRAFLATRLAWVFRTSGRSGVETAPVAELEPARRDALLAIAQPAADDILVIGYYRDDEHWLLLALDRLRAQHAGHRIEIATSDIATARVGDARDKQTGIANATLEVVLTDRTSIVVGIESGAPLVGLLNVLKRLL